MNQKGFSPILIPVGVILLILGSGAFFINANRSKNSDLQPFPVAITSPSPISSPSPSAASSSIVKPSVKPSIKPTLKPSAAPTATASPTPQPESSSNPGQSSQAVVPTPTPAPTPKVTCSVHFDPTTGSAPQDVKLIYGASFNYHDDYVTNVQWDWDGDGNWDTDLSLNNQHLSHIYDQPGTYTAKMHLQTKNGLSSDTCSGIITIQ